MPAPYRPSLALDHVSCGLAGTTFTTIPVKSIPRTSAILPIRARLSNRHRIGSVIILRSDEQLCMSVSGPCLLHTAQTTLVCQSRPVGDLCQASPRATANQPPSERTHPITGLINRCENSLRVTPASQPPSANKSSEQNTGQHVALVHTTLLADDSHA